MAVRVLSTSLGHTFWQKAIASLNDDQEGSGEPVKLDYNENLFRNFVEPAAVPVLVSMLGIGILLDLVCWRYRKVANCLFAFECV